jgi:NADH-quinone oxidoreductase subunit L
MLAGTLAITGVGVIGVFGFAGFYSKDAILEAAFASGSDTGQFAFWVGVVAALMTSFYSWRLVFLTFFGKPRWDQSEHIQHAVHGEHEDPSEEHSEEVGHGHAHAHAHGDHGHDAHGDGTAGYHPHESPPTMLVPLIVLTILFGFYPAPILDATAASVSLVAENFGKAIGAAAPLVASAH